MAIASITIIMMEEARSSSILDVFTDLLNLGCEKGGVTDDFHIFGLSDLKNGVTI